MSSSSSESAKADSPPKVKAKVVKEKETKAPAKIDEPCREWIKTGGKSCSYGKKCRFLHELSNDNDVKPKASTSIAALDLHAPPPAAKISQNTAAVAKCIALDVHVDDTVLQQWQAVCEWKIVNGNAVSKPHAQSRALRHIAVSMLDFKVEGGLEVQGKARAYLPATVRKEVCRKPYFPEDTQVCPTYDPATKFCSHDLALDTGEIDKVKFVDVPLSPIGLQGFLAVYSHVKSVYMLCHLYPTPGRYEDQDVAWFGGETPNSYEKCGSFGLNRISAVGTATIEEPDQHWLISGFQPAGLKIEELFRVGSYACFCVTHLPQSVPQRVLRIPPSDVFSPQLQAGRYKVSDMVVAKYAHDNFVAVLPNLGTRRFSASDVQTIFRASDGKKMTVELRGALASQYSHGTHRMAFDDALLIATELKRLAEAEPLRVRYEPAPERAWWLQYFPFFHWLAPSRHVVEQEHSALRAALGMPQLGERASAARNWFRCSLAALLVAFVPWIAPTWVEEFRWPQWYAWHHFEFKAWGLNFGGWAILPDLIPHWQALVTFRLEWWNFLPWIPARLFMVILFLFCFFKSGANVVYAQPCAVRELYTATPFVAIDYDGPLDTVNRALPGYVSASLESPIATDAFFAQKFIPLPKEPHDALFATSVVTGWVPTVAWACLENERLAIINRQLMTTPAYNETVFQAWSSVFLAAFPFGKSPGFKPVSFDEWNKNFPSGRKLEHVRAREAWLTGASAKESDILRREMFLKIEKIWKRSHWDPRAITAASDTWNVLTGPWFKGMAKTIYSIFRLDNEQNNFIATETNARELGRWFERALDIGGTAVLGDDQLIIVPGHNGVLIIVGDGRRHDAHMHQHFYSLKWAVYEVLAGGLGWVGSLAKKGQAFTYGVGQFGTRYSHPFRVRSGDPDTSSGNSLLTLFITQVLRAKVLLYGETAVDRIVQEIRDELGYDLELYLTHDLTEAELLQGYFVPVGGRYFWVPKIGRLMNSLGWTIVKPINEYKSWTEMASTLNGFGPFRFMPFFRIYFDKVASLIPIEFRHVLPKFDPHHPSTIGVDAAEPEEDTWGFIQSRYGLDVDDEKLFSVDMKRVTVLPYMLQSATLDVIVKRDM